MRVAVFGDVHGRPELLSSLVKEIRKKYGLSIEIWSVGDLLDRGPDSKGVIDICLHEGIEAVIGNHDQWVIELITRKFFNPNVISSSMGGHHTIASYGVEWDDKRYSDVAVDFLGAIPENHIGYFLGMEYYAKLDWLDKDCWITHAGVTEGMVKTAKRAGHESDDEVMNFLGSHRQNQLCWNQPHFRGKKDEMHHFENGIQIFGHSFTKSPVVKEHFVGLDTIGWGKEDIWTLSCVILPDMEIIQVKA